MAVEREMLTGPARQIHFEREEDRRALGGLPSADESE